METTNEYGDIISQEKAIKNAFGGKKIGVIFSGENHVQWFSGEDFLTSFFTVQERNHLKHALQVVAEASIGETIAFEGSCPSGPTYEGFLVWDGTQDSLEKIIRKAIALSLPNAREAWAIRYALRGRRGTCDMCGGTAEIREVYKEFSIPDYGEAKVARVLFCTLCRRSLGNA